MRVLVTGAEGFIGSHLVESLVFSGHKVRAMVQYNSFGSIGWLSEIPQNVLSHVQIVHSDIRDMRGCEDACKDVDSVIHLAALIAIPHSYDHPSSYIATNIVGTHNLLEASLKTNIELFIQTSTSEVYGSAQYVPIDENHPLNPQSPYAATKVGADQLARSYWASYGLPVITIRPFNTFGPRQSQRAVIPTIIAQYLSNQHELKIGSLTPTRDFTFVKDTAQGFVNALTSPAAIGETVNLGNGFEVSVQQVIDLVSEEFGTRPEVFPDEERLRPEKSEVTRLLASNVRAKELLNWEPTLRGLDGFRIGLSETIKWQKEWQKSGGRFSAEYVK